MLLWWPTCGALCSTFSWDAATCRGQYWQLSLAGVREGIRIFRSSLRWKVTWKAPKWRLPHTQSFSWLLKLWPVLFHLGPIAICFREVTNKLYLLYTWATKFSATISGMNYFWATPSSLLSFNSVTQFSLSAKKSNKLLFSSVDSSENIYTFWGRFSCSYFSSAFVLLKIIHRHWMKERKK